MKKILRILPASVFAIMAGTTVALAEGNAASAESSGFWSSYGIYLIVALAVLILAGVIIVLIKRNGASGAMGPSVDSLTGLGNKRHARTYFNSLVRSQSDAICLGYIAMDMAMFTSMNDREKSNELQKHTAELLSAFCGETDYAARIDEGAFVIILSCRSSLIAQQRINDLVDNLNQHQTESAGELVSPFHAGLFFESGETSGFDAALRNTLLAYRHACDNQMNFYVCTKELLKSESYRNHLRDKLSHAIDNNQFEMFLQFIYNVEEDKFTSAEVLSRWNNPLEGFLMPAYYINDMRTTGVIKKFDMYMLDKTCRQLAEWSTGPFSDLRLSCNITRITISAPDFMPGLRSILKKYKFDRSHLMLEITEDALIDKTIAYQNIVTCKEEGIRIAIDDLCAGHSTLEDISDYPMDQIKLDRHVIVRTTTQRGNALLKELIGMAHRLNIEVVCEGVETEAQRNAVIDNGCDFVQGYFYSYVFPISEGKDYYLKSLKEHREPAEQK